MAPKTPGPTRPPDQAAPISTTPGDLPSKGFGVDVADLFGSAGRELTDLSSPRRQWRYSSIQPRESLALGSAALLLS